MAALGSRRSSSLTGLYTTSFEKWYEPQTAIDIISEANVLFWLMENLPGVKETGVYGFDIIKNLMEVDDATVDSFEYHDPVPTDPVKGPTASRFSLSNYVAPLNVSWQEEVENKTAVRITSLLKFKLSKILIGMANRFDRDFQGGNTAKATNFLGLEDLLYAAAQGSPFTIGETTDRWVYRQQTNTYGTVTRTPWTSPTAGGTGWEALTVDFTDSPAQTFGYSSTAPYPPNAATRQLEIICDLASVGADYPNIFYSSYKPWYDMKVAGQTKVSLEKETDTWNDLNIPFRNIKWGPAVWFPSHKAKSLNINGDDATADTDQIMGWCMRYWKYLVEQDADFKLRKAIPMSTQIASVRHIVHRAQQVYLNPRTAFRIYNYGETT